MDDRGSLLSVGEERLLLSLGYLVMRWNYAEHFVRQILRQQIDIDSILDPNSIKISNRPPVGLIEDIGKLSKELEQTESGPYLSHLTVAFKMAREHRNHLVHGIFMTADMGDGGEPIAMLHPSKIDQSRFELPSQVSLQVIEATSHYFHDLAMFTREISIGFSRGGKRAIDAAGVPVIATLPPFIEILPPVTRIYHDGIEV